MPDLLRTIFHVRDPTVRILHLSWIAFFLCFVVWFNQAALLGTISEALGLTEDQTKALFALNVALTIPARVLIGMLVDRYGPRKIYTGLLAASSLLCLGFASAQTFEQLALFRFLMGFVGAGFVIGIRLVSEWFPAKQVGLAEGIYGGWGNFGSAAAAFSLPSLALLFGGEDGWRYAIATTGLVAALYAVAFYRNVRDTPRGATYFKPKRSGGLEVTSWRDLSLYLAMNVPMYGALAVLTWRLSPASVDLLSFGAVYGLLALLLGLFVLQSYQIYRINAERLTQGVPELHRYAFRQVAILDIAYMVGFGCEIAVASMLPYFYSVTFPGISSVTAGLLGGAFASTNLIARPLGGWLSDRFGRRLTLSVAMCGMSLSFVGMSQIDGSWPLWLAVLVTLLAGPFVQAANGAVYAIVPLIQRRMTGQIAGMVGAYGNVGGVLFLTALAAFEYSLFFLVIAAAAALCFVAVRLLREPRGHLAEIQEDGTVQLIEVA